MATFERRQGFWRVKVRRAGFPAQSRSFDNKALAQAWAREVESKMDRGDFIDRTEADDNTLGDVLRRYAKVVSPTKKGHESEQLHIRSILKYEVCHFRMSVLKSSNIAAFRDERAEDVSAGTVNRELTILSHAIETARREWDIYMPDNPVQRVRRLKPPLPRSRRLSPLEERRLFEACAQSRGKFLVPAVRLAIETAMRRGEIVRIERRHVDLHNCVLLLPDTKNGSPRPVPLSDVAIETIRKVLTDLPDTGDGLLFSGVTSNALDLAFSRALRRSKIEDFRFHDLRHEATSRLHEKGLNPIEVMSVTGHKSMASMVRYSHVRGLEVTRKLNNPLPQVGQ
jgi:integrase